MVISFLLIASRVLADTEVRLHHLVAEAYLRLGYHRLARVYVERIYGPLASWDNRHNKEKFPLQIPQDGPSPSVYAELLLVAAKISITHGHHGEAFAELEEAFKLDDSNEDINEFVEQRQPLWDLRADHWNSIRDREERVTRRKFDSM